MKVTNAIQTRIKNMNPDHISIARGMAWVAMFIFLGKLAGAAKEMVVAYRYGVSNQVDAYLFVFNLINWPIGVWFGVLNYVLVPLAARMRHDSLSELPRFRAELLAFTLILGVDFAVIAWLGLPILLRASWMGLSDSTLSIAISILPEMIPLLPLGVLTSLFSAWMLSSERHANTLLESIPALVILLALLIFPNNGIEPLVLGTLVGLILQVFSLAIPLAWKGEIEKPIFSQRSPGWVVFWQGFGILLFGNFLMSFIGIIDQFFAAHLGSGVIATISYANRVLGLIIGLGASAVSRATLPVFSKIHPQESYKLQHVAMIWVRLMLVLGIIAMIISWWLAPWMIKVLFERGAFTSKDTAAVTEVFQYGLIQLPFYFSSLVMVTLLASRQQHKLIAINASIALFIKMGANYFLVPLMGINGIITATSVMYMVSFIALYWLATKSYKTISKGENHYEP